MDLRETLKRSALEVGFDLAGIAPAAAADDLTFSRAWVEAGYAGDMSYLSNPKRSDPRLVLSSVQSILCVGLVYNTRWPYSTMLVPGSAERGVGPAESGSRDAARAWISRYAWGTDYHDVMRRKLERLRSEIESLAPGVETRVYADTGPVIERAFARYSGIGWMGKNTCLINQQKGSWFFLGVILTNLALPPDMPAADRCGSCTRCIDACPTGALEQPYRMDARRCISYLTIEHQGAAPESLRAAIGNNVFGCDICQDVCPWNSSSSPSTRSESEPPTRRSVAVTDQSEFQPREIAIEYDEEPNGREGSGDSSLEACGLSQAPTKAAQLQNNSAPRPRLPVRISLFHPELRALASLSESEFRRVFSHSPIRRAKYRGWLRNLCTAMGNSGDRRLIPWLERAAQHPDEAVRDHARWALTQLLASPNQN